MLEVGGPKALPEARTSATLVRDGVCVQEVTVVNALGGGAAFPVEDGAPPAIHYVENLVHQPGEYLRAMVRAGLVVRDLRESLVDDALAATFPAHGAFPEATQRAFGDLPYLLVWHAERPE